MSKEGAQWTENCLPAGPTWSRSPGKKGGGVTIGYPDSYGDEHALAGVCGTRKGLAHAYGAPNA